MILMDTDWMQTENWKQVLRQCRTKGEKAAARRQQVSPMPNVESYFPTNMRFYNPEADIDQAKRAKQARHWFLWDIHIERNESHFERKPRFMIAHKVFGQYF